MCGIGGVFSLGGPPTQNQLTNIAQALANRGPDDEGYWRHESLPLAFVHRRLSIIDTSDAGHQPIFSSCGRYVVTFNGEIYNFAELSKELVSQGKTFRGHCDSEVLVEAISAWGFEKTVDRLNGMFAFVVFDRQDRRLMMARDRLGEKPLYFGWSGDSFGFGSQLRVISGLATAQLEINRYQLLNYLQFAYVPAPHSIYENIVKLPPGHRLSISIAQLEDRISVTELLDNAHRYWNPVDVWQQAQNEQGEFSDGNLLQKVEEQLTQTVASRMVADVPLGAFLSGGVDSSLIVALMKKVSSKPVKTFSIGFDDERMNEAHDAKAIAQHLSTDHTELYLSPDHLLNVIPELPSIYDEPFADSSQLPTYIVSRMARESVTVALSGDAGDEVFGGYNRYIWAPRIWQKIKGLPSPLRRLAASLLGSASPDRWDRMLGPLGHVPGVSVPRQIGGKLHKIAKSLRATNRYELYHSLCTQWDNSANLVLGIEPPQLVVPDYWDEDGRSYAQNMILSDLQTYLADDILAKVDRASMAVGLEVRAPFLDHDIISMAMQLPAKQLINGGTSKSILRSILYQHVPRALIDRPKMGFGAPIAAWLRGPLREWAHDHLASEVLQRDGFINSGMVTEKLQQHDAGSHNWDGLLWSVLMFQTWLQFEKDRGMELA